VAHMAATMTSWLVRGLPRQFMVMRENAVEQSAAYVQSWLRALKDDKWLGCGAGCPAPRVNTQATQL